MDEDMKANEVPERLYLSKNIYSTFLYQVPDPDDETAVKYTRTDAFVEKACEFWKDHLAGYDICDDDIERSVESFKLAMKL